MVFRQIGKLISNIGRGARQIMGGSFGESLGSSLEKLQNIRIVSDSDVRIHTPELLLAASEIALAMRNIRLTAGVDEETLKLCNEVLKNAEEMTRVVDKFGQNVESGMTNFGLNHFKATVETIFAHFNFYLATAVFLSFSICVVNKEESWARSTMSVFALTATLCFSYMLAREFSKKPEVPSASASSSASEADDSVSPIAVSNPSTPRSPMHKHPDGQSSRHLIDMLHPSSITSPEPHDDHWAARKISFHSDACFHPKHAYENTYVAIDLEAVYWCNKFELRSRGEHDQYVTAFEIHYKVNENDEYTILAPHNRNPFQQFMGLQNDKQHKIYENFNPFIARYVKVVPRAYSHVPCIKFEISGVLMPNKSQVVLA